MTRHERLLTIPASLRSARGSVLQAFASRRTHLIGEAA